jgi:hypothetical protein
LVPLKKVSGAGGVAGGVEGLPSKYEPGFQIPVPPKTKQNKKAQAIFPK